MNAEIINRKGARKLQDIPKDVMAYLNKGKIESVNLTEWLGIDHSLLIKNTYKQIGLSEKLAKTISIELATQKNASTMNSTKLIGALLYENLKGSKKLEGIFNEMSNHTSDSVRCYATYLIGLDADLNIKEKLNKAMALIADNHFGVREVVWMAMRPSIETDLSKAIKILSSWTKDKDENVRRFTTEATRPRGVWCKHIDILKEKPELLLPILEALKNDEAKYVQDSVANWLNDASKSKPTFVQDLCKKWQKDSATINTEKIIKRALRTINK